MATRFDLRNSERTRSDLARCAAPRRALVLLSIALVVAGALRFARVLFGWSFDTTTIILGAILAALLLVGLPMALAGGGRGYDPVDIETAVEESA
jgi:hypothetical protein